MTQNNYNWTTFNLQTIYGALDTDPITLTGLIGVCTTSSGLTTYALDCSGYLLIITNTGTIANPSLTYTYLKISSSPFTGTLFIIPTNCISCSSNGENIIIAYPTVNNDVTIFIYYMINFEFTPVVSLISGLPFTTTFPDLPVIGIAPAGQFVGILDTSLSPYFLYLSTDYGLYGFKKIEIAATTFAFSTIGLNVYIASGGSIYILDYNSVPTQITQTSIVPQLDQAEISLTLPYLDTTGQYFNIIGNSEGSGYIYSSKDYTSTCQATKISSTTALINNTNNSLGKILIMSQGGNVYTSINGSTFTQETFFTTGLTVYCVSTNYCDSNNPAMAVCIGLTNTDSPPNVFNFYYGYI